MSFMFNPYRDNILEPINRPGISVEATNQVVAGQDNTTEYLADVINRKLDETDKQQIVVALDGYLSADFDSFIKPLSQLLNKKNIACNLIDISEVYKSSEELEKEIDPLLPENLDEDPVLLFGQLFEGGVHELMDDKKLTALENKLSNAEKEVKKVVVVWGCGCTVKQLRSQYDMIVYLDVTPKETILRIKSRENPQPRFI